MKTKPAEKVDYDPSFVSLLYPSMTITNETIKETPKR